MSITRNAAETIALQSLEWLVGNEDLLPVFMASTGVSTDEIRGAAREPDFLGSVLDFILMDDAWIIACCDAQSMPYARLMEARHGLPGGEQIHWT